MSLTGVIARMSTGTYTVTRRTAATYDASGALVAGSTTTLTINASVQNGFATASAGRTMRTLPEAQHSDDVRVLFTTTELRPRTPTVDADRVTIDGEAFEVWQVRKASIRAVFYRCLVSRKVVP